MNIPSCIKAISFSSCRFSSRHLQYLNFPRSIATTTFSAKPQPPPQPQPQSQPQSQPQPPSQLTTVSASSSSSAAAAAATATAAQPARKPHQSSITRRRKRLVPRLCPFNAYRATPYKLVKTYTQKLSRGHPMLIRNLPGFLDEQHWIDHLGHHEGAFKFQRNPPKKGSDLGFDILKALLANVKGYAQRSIGYSSEPANLRAVFDDFEAECKISRTSLHGDNPPLLMFRDWLPQSEFRDYSLDRVIVEIQRAYHARPQPWIPFTAPLMFFRAVHQYNRDQRRTADTVSQQDDSTDRQQDHSACIDGLNSLVVLEETLTEEFPFPRIIQDIGQSTYKTKSCSIRVGVRPLRSDMRRHKQSTTVVGQLSGYSLVTMIPPRLKLLNGLSLEFHKRVPRTWERSTKRFPLGSPNFSLSSKTWTRDFENELSASGDVLLATLIPGDGLLVPEGWWYGVRSINNELQLHATVTWFLSRGELPAADQEEYAKDKYLRRFAPRVEI